MVNEDRRRRYVVTAVRKATESTAECDARIARLLGYDPKSSSITLSVYDPASHEIVKVES